MTAAVPETPAVTLAAAMTRAFTEPGMAALVKSAQLHDLACRPPGNWRRVSDHQAARLIAGALADLYGQAGMTPAMADQGRAVSAPESAAVTAGQAARIEGECTVCAGQNGNHASWCGHARKGGDWR